MKNALVRADGARLGHFVVVMCRDPLPMSTVKSAIIITNAACTSSSDSGQGNGAGSGTCTVIL